MSKPEMIALALNRLKLSTRLNRIITYLMMVVGIVMFFSYMTDILGYIPMVGGLLQSTLLLVIMLGAVIVCIPLWMITFSLAWLWYHPKVGVVFFSVGVVMLTVILIINNITGS